MFCFVVSLLLLRNIAYLRRWHCKACGYLSVNRNALLQHFGKRHNGESPEHEPLSPDNAIEDWVCTWKTFIPSHSFPYCMYVEEGTS